MALFTNSDIAEVKSVHTEKRRSLFATKFAISIDRELEFLAALVRACKDNLLKDLKGNAIGFKTTSAEIVTCRSFDFSEVGGGNALYSGNISMTYNQVASAWVRASFRDDDGLPVNRYLLWKSKDFLKRLATKLELPEEMYFQVNSTQIGEDDTFFDDQPKIKEYSNTLYIVLRLAK